MKDRDPNPEMKKLYRRLLQIRDQQVELQENICNLAYTMSLQLQVLEELSDDLEELYKVSGLRSKPKLNKIVHLKEYLERIPR